MQAVMGFLNIRVPDYDSKRDPLFKLHTPIRIRELKTFSRSPLPVPTEEDAKPDVKPLGEFVGEGGEKEQRVFADHCYARSNGTDAGWNDASGSDTEVDEGASDGEGAAEDVKREAPDEGGEANCGDTKRAKLLGWYGKGCAKWRLRKKR